MKILWGTKVGAANWEEEIITENEELIPAARAWAEKHGYNRLRVAEMSDKPEMPNFAECVKIGREKR